MSGELSCPFLDLERRKARVCAGMIRHQENGHATNGQFTNGIKPESLKNR